MFTRWNASLSTGDPAQVVANYAPDSVLLPTLSNTVRYTSAEKEEYFVHFLLKGPKAFINERTIELDCNSASDVGVYTFYFKDGSSVKARYTFTYKKYNGQWLIWSHHSSAMPEVPPSPLLRIPGDENSDSAMLLGDNKLSGSFRFKGKMTNDFTASDQQLFIQTIKNLYSSSNVPNVQITKVTQIESTQSALTLSSVIIKNQHRKLMTVFDLIVKFDVLPAQNGIGNQLHEMQLLFDNLNHHNVLSFHSLSTNFYKNTDVVLVKLYLSKPDLSTCPPGTFVINKGCKLCAPNFYSETKNADMCLACPHESTAPNFGSSSCISEKSSSSQTGIIVGVTLGSIAFAVIITLLAVYSNQKSKEKK